MVKLKPGDVLADGIVLLTTATQVRTCAPAGDPVTWTIRWTGDCDTLQRDGEDVDAGDYAVVAAHFQWQAGARLLEAAKKEPYGSVYARCTWTGAAYTIARRVSILMGDASRQAGLLLEPHSSDLPHPLVVSFDDLVRGFVRTGKES